jgi:hypothetical protein
VGIAFSGEEYLLRKGVVRWKGSGRLLRIIFSLACGYLEDITFDVSDKLTRAKCRICSARTEINHHDFASSYKLVLETSIL